MQNKIYVGNSAAKSVLIKDPYVPSKVQYLYSDEYNNKLGSEKVKFEAETKKYSEEFKNSELKFT